MSRNPVSAGTDMVLTPGGYKPRTKVCRLGKDTPPPADPSPPPGVQHAPIAGVGAPAPAVQPGQGWVAYTAWIKEQQDPIQLFTGSWTVPPEPKNKSGQTVFLFIGLQNNRFILQPVLQWGPSHAGGGDFWSIANWYTDGTKDQTFCSDAVPVKVGQELTAQIEVVSRVGQAFTYRSSFEGFPQLDMVRNDVIELRAAFVVLEAYHISSNQDYPAAPKTQIQPQLSIAAAPASPDWVILPRPLRPVPPRAVLNTTAIDLFF